MKGDTREIGEDYQVEGPQLCDLDMSKTYKGLIGVYVDDSLITFIDGMEGMLYYRGYPLEDLVDNSSFEEVAYLLIYGKLPTKSEFTEFTDILIKERNIPDNILTILKSFPRNTTRIELLRTAISALSLYDPDDYDYSELANIRKGLRIVSKMPTILAFSHRIQTNLPLIEPSEELSHAANYYYMMTGNKPDKEFEEAFDDVLILPGFTNFSPSQVDLSSDLGGKYHFNLPIISSAMDTVTEENMAISMALHGGLGVLHRNCAFERQLEMVRIFKRARSFVIDNVATITPNAKVSKAKFMMENYNISGIVVTNDENKVCGIFTKRDIPYIEEEIRSFCDNQKVEYKVYFHHGSFKNAN